jgi:hypothetical protein
MFTVGATVRVELPRQTICRRAVVSTLLETATKTCGAAANEKEVCILWESQTPRPLVGTFLVAPDRLSRESSDEEDVEVAVPIHQISHLFPFETEDYCQAMNTSSSSSTSDSVSLWKDHGDQLLRIRDACAALPYYEAALWFGAKVQVGATVLIKLSGRAVLAEVDYLENDSVDITIVETVAEQSVAKRDILLSILDPDMGHLQERTLLNLTRCLLLLAETAATTNNKNRPFYLRSAVLGCTLAIEIASFHKKEQHDDNDKALTDTETTALLLRSQAQAELIRFPHAFADVKRVLADNPEHKEGCKALQTLHRRKALQVKADRKLVKSVSRWVQSAIVKEDEESATSSSVSAAEAAGAERSTAALHQPSDKRRSQFPWFLLSAVALFAWFVQKSMQE